MDHTEFLLRPSKNTLSQAIETNYLNYNDNLPMKLKAAEKQLAIWAGEYLTKTGYKMTSAELRMEENDYKTRLGIGVFMDVEKYDDVRGFLLHSYEITNDLKESNKRLRKSSRQSFNKRIEVEKLLKKIFIDSNLENDIITDLASVTEEVIKYFETIDEGED